jgi:hypothetical protein
MVEKLKGDPVELLGPSLEIAVKSCSACGLHITVPAQVAGM